MKKILFIAGIGIAAAIVAPLSTRAISSSKRPRQNLEAAGFTPFVDPLPILPRLVVPGDQREITVHLTQFHSKLHRDFTNSTTMWGYNGASPGPVIEVESGHPLRVHWKNELPITHVLSAPSLMMTAGPMPGDRIVFDGPKSAAQDEQGGFFHMLFDTNSTGLPDVRNVTHLHGAKVSETDPMNPLENNDGWPDAWTVPGQEQVSDYPNDQDARTLFFHDHAFGETGRNVAAGLVGVYEIHDDFERSLNLPSGAYDIPIVFQGSIISGFDGSRKYTDRVDNEYYGNSVLVNGKLLPFLSVEPRKYRFRFVNASNARAYGLSLVDIIDHKTPGPPFMQIGSDAGFLERAVTTSDYANPAPLQLFLASAERADVIVDFSKFAGRNFVLFNTNAVTDPDGEIAVPQLMEFKVEKQVSGTDTSSLPTEIRHIEPLAPAAAVATRRIVLSQEDHPDGSTLFQLDKRSWVYPKKDDRGQSYWDYEISNKAKANTTEIWEIVNTSTLQHPFHVHLVQFQVLDRRPFDVDAFNAHGNVIYTGDAKAPDANESGWKDVIRANAHQVTRLIMHFGPETGYYVYHCHILEHEDMDMMVPFQVVP
jgi:spore coat protein A